MRGGGRGGLHARGGRAGGGRSGRVLADRRVPQEGDHRLQQDRETDATKRDNPADCVCERETCSRSENGAYCKRGLQHTATARNESADKKSERRQEFSLSNQTSAKLISLVSRHQVRVVDQLFSLISTHLSSLIPIITAFLPPKVNSLSHLEYILCAETR